MRCVGVSIGLGRGCFPGVGGALRVLRGGLRPLCSSVSRLRRAYAGICGGLRPLRCRDAGICGILRPVSGGFPSLSVRHRLIRGRLRVFHSLLRRAAAERKRSSHQSAD
jgi:hypothetical protein